MFFLYIKNTLKFTTELISDFIDKDEFKLVLPSNFPFFNYNLPFLMILTIIENLFMVLIDYFDMILPINKFSIQFAILPFNF